MVERGNEDDILAEFQYLPSIAACVVAMVLFFLVSCVIAAQCWRSRVRYPWILVFAGLWETAGYVSRLVAIYSSGNTSEDSFVASLVIIILIVNFLALVNYLTVGKLIELTGVGWRHASARRLSLFFFASDIICIAVQGAGGAMLSSSVEAGDKASETGQKLILIGISIQLAFFAAFSLVALLAQRQDAMAGGVIRRIYAVLWATIVLISIRNIYRIAEVAVGWTAYLNTHEAFFYCLDALPIFLAFVAYALYPFGRAFEALQRAKVHVVA